MRRSLSQKLTDRRTWVYFSDCFMEAFGGGYKKQRKNKIKDVTAAASEI